PPPRYSPLLSVNRKDTSSVMANSSAPREHEGHEGSDVYVDSGVGEPDRLERIWAPFRMAYINKRTKDPFVEAPKKDDEEALIIARRSEEHTSELQSRFDL